MFTPQRASFSCTALVGTNKAGILKPDADGYYTVVLGALDFYNTAGSFYPFESAKELFKESSSLMRRIANGCLHGEMGHPRKQPGMSQRDFVNRVMDIHETNICCHIRKVTIDYGSVKDAQGRPCIAIIGEVKPTGPMGPALKEALDNPSQNVCFSIRSLTNDIMVGGVVHKHLRAICTWDAVVEPGISVANKWRSPALESLVEETIVPAQLLALREAQRGTRVSMETHGGLSAESLLRDLGWDVGKTEARPLSARW